MDIFFSEREREKTKQNSRKERGDKGKNGLVDKERGEGGRAQE